MSKIPVIRICKVQLNLDNKKKNFFFYLLDFIVYIPANLQTSRFSLSATDVEYITRNKKMKYSGFEERERDRDSHIEHI